MTYYGFNFLWMYIKSREDQLPLEPDLRELDFMVKHGFNFVRIPTDYHFWTKDFEYTNPNEKIIEYIDRYIKECNARNLHVSLNIHRAPGYCINWPEREKHNLWRDKEAQEGFIFIWKYFAKRYKNIPSSLLSFDLVNEPACIEPTHPCTRDDHEKLIRKTIAAIRSIDENRQIVVDGFDGGASALPELADLADKNVIQSGRGYEPFLITHHKADWVNGADKWELPDYKGGEECREKLREFYRPWIKLQNKGVPIHIGEFGCYNKIPNEIALRWFADILSVFKEFSWGYSLWNFKGDFGVCEHNRENTVYEEIDGLKIDKELLNLLKDNMVN